MPAQPVASAPAPQRQVVAALFADGLVVETRQQLTLSIDHGQRNLVDVLRLKQPGFLTVLGTGRGRVVNAGEVISMGALRV